MKDFGGPVHKIITVPHRAPSQLIVYPGTIDGQHFEQRIVATVSQCPENLQIAESTLTATVLPDAHVLPGPEPQCHWNQSLQHHNLTWEADATFLLCTLLVFNHPPTRDVFGALKDDVVPPTCQGWVKARFFNHPHDATEGDYKDHMRDFGREPDSYVNNHSLVDHNTHKLGIAYKIGLRTLKSGSSSLRKQDAISI